MAKQLDFNCHDWIISDSKGHKSWSTEVNTNNNTEYKPLVKYLSAKEEKIVQLRSNIRKVLR